MVKLPSPNEQPARVVGERARPPRPRSHHNAGAKFGRYRVRQRGEPTGLLELEAMARHTVELMEKQDPKPEGNYQKTMYLLRQQYNLNFIIVCENCGGTHDQDELVAPER